MSKFNSTQQQLYAVVRAAWASCSSRLASFTAFKPKYIAAFVTAKLAAITAAEALPDQEQREEDSKILRIQLQNKNIDCLDLWQRLKLYIEEAYPENELDTQLTAAGQSHYEGAGDEWAVAKGGWNMV